jgi:hypothetical protein
MFDRYDISPAQQYISVNASITEKRAPTDDSVRLLREMEAKAREQVIKTIRLDDNDFKCVVHIMNEVHSGDIKYAVLYSLNGKRIETRFQHADFEKLDDMIPKLIDAVATDIAKNIMAKPFAEAMNKHQPYRKGY